MLQCIMMCPHFLYVSSDTHAPQLSLYFPIIKFSTVAVVMRVVVEPVSNTSVNVSWESVTVPGIVNYTVYYRPETMRRQCEQSVTVPSSDSSVVIEDLITNVEYQFQVATVAELGGVISLGERSPSTQVLVASPTPTLSSNPMLTYCLSNVDTTTVIIFANT